MSSNKKESKELIVTHFSKEVSLDRIELIRERLRNPELLASNNFELYNHLQILLDAEVKLFRITWITSNEIN